MVEIASAAAENPCKPRGDCVVVVEELLRKFGWEPQVLKPGLCFIPLPLPWLVVPLEDQCYECQRLVLQSPSCGHCLPYPHRSR